MRYFKKYFTVEEANGLLPELRRLLRDIREEAEKQEKDREKLSQLNGSVSSNGGGKTMDGYLQSNRTIAARLAEIDERGVQIKDVRRGLLDFPALRYGEEILLCWLSDEPEVAFWHTLEEGFAGRRPVSEL
jgi:hypothetical protein